jgi:peptide deformylase
MIRKIVQYGHPVLRQRCRPITVIDDNLAELAKDMLDTMVDANGVGLAAPQIGLDIRLAVIDVSHDPESITYFRINGVEDDVMQHMPLVFINPELEYGQEKEFGQEGCLSIRGIRADVQRPIDVKVKLTLLNGQEVTIETDGLLARALQHEIDHLNGILFTDRLPAASKVALKNRLKRLLDENSGR